MGISEKKMREILGRDIKVSELTERRLQDTYRMLKDKPSEDKRICALPQSLQRLYALQYQELSMHR